MKKLFVLIAALALITYGCKKDQPQPTNQLVDVSFSGKLMSRDVGAKLGDECFSEVADFAVISIDGTPYTSEVYYIDGDPYTKAIKLSPGVHHVDAFDLYIDVNHDGVIDAIDGPAMASIPTDNSDYEGFVTDGVPIEFTVGDFTKIEIPVEVLCFEDYLYDHFGFFWYTYDEVIVRTQCVFGDLCIKDLDDYAGSLYANQPGGVKLDMPAIIQLDITRNGENFLQVNNELDANGNGWYGVGAPLCFEYPDLLGSVDTYVVTLSVLVADGPSFAYKVFDTWTFQDDQMIPAGDDGVVDFVIGNCVLSGGDYVYPPYMDLPATCTFTVSNTYAPGTAGGYIDAILTNIPAGYDLYNGTWASWCFDRDVNIYLGQTYDMNVYSSLYPASMPAYLANNDWDRANWIMNHLGWYSGYTWADIQGAMWLLDVPQWGGGAEAGVPALNTLLFAQQMYNDAVAAVTGTYAPPPGGWAAVVFGVQDPPIVQTVFVVVDP